MPEKTEATTDRPETILVERHGRAGLLIINRPQALNALNSKVARESGRPRSKPDGQDEAIGASFVLTGSRKGLRGGRGYQGDVRLRLLRRAFADVSSRRTGASTRTRNQSSRPSPALRSAADASSR